MSAPQVEDDVMRDLKRDLQALGAVYPDDIEPPAQADDAIRAAARRAVRAKPGTESFWWPHTPPLAAAAVLVLTVSIAFLAMDDPQVQMQVPVQESGNKAPPGVVVQIAPPQDPPAAAVVPEQLPKVAARAELRADASASVGAAATTATTAAANPAANPAANLSARAVAKPQEPSQVAAKLERSPLASDVMPRARGPVSPPVGYAASPPALPPPAVSNAAPAAPRAEAAPSPPVLPASPASPVAAAPMPAPAPFPAPAASASTPSPVSVARAPLASETVRAAPDDPRLKGLEKRERYQEPSTQAQAAPAKPAMAAAPQRAPLAFAPAPQTGEVKVERSNAEKFADTALAAESPRPTVAATPVVRAPARLADAPPVTSKLAPRMLQEDVVLMPMLWAGSIRNMQSSGKTKEAEQEIARFKQRYPVYPIDEVLQTPALFSTKADIEATPAAWVLQIRSLRAMDQQKDAEAELVRFRQRYPNYSLPEALREKK